MKADIARYFSTVLGHPCAFVGLTGVSNINQYVRMLEELKRFGINTIKVAFDMDLHVNENVRKARDRVIQVGCENGFEVRGSRPACVPAAAGVDRVFCSCVPPFSLACSVSKVLVHR